MTLFLEVIDGELKGTRVPLKQGFTIGRRDCDLTIRDSKLSGKHAMIEQRPDGFWLADQKSANGIKLGETRVLELKLTENVAFTLGRTKFTVTLAAALSDDAATAQEPTVTRTWRDSINELTIRAIAEAKLKKLEITPFSTPVHLKIIRGPQAGTDWTLGYGPRAVGSNVVDLKLEDENLPGLCFRLIPKESAVVLKNETDGVTRLNGKSVAEAQLKDGDVIDLRDTQIKVVIDDRR